MGCYVSLFMKRSDLKTGLLIGLLTFCCNLTARERQQSIISPETFQNASCGNPLMESNVWFTRKVKVLQILTGDTLLVQLDKQRQLTVVLSGISAPKGTDAYAKESLAHLKGLLGGKTIELQFNPSEKDLKQKNSIICVVHLGVADVNLTMIQKGLARYQEPPSYVMSNYTACTYRLAEKEAQKFKVGLWQNPT